MREGIAQESAYRIAIPIACALLARPIAFTPVVDAETPSTATPNVHVLSAPFTIPGLNRVRTVRGYLPPDDEHSKRRCPVLYMHDGQKELP